MRFNFKKISAIGTSLLMTGMTMGIGAAANYPMPFVKDGSADVAIVYGGSSDKTHAMTIQDDLGPHVTKRSSSSSSTSTGERFPLFSQSKKIYLGESLTSGAEDEVEQEDLGDVLEETEFNGNEDVDVEYKIVIGTGADGHARESGKVVFDNHPDKDDDPRLGISLGDKDAPLYESVIEFSDDVDFTHSDSKGQGISLFGREFTVSSDTDSNELVLFRESTEIKLGDGEGETLTSKYEGYTLELVDVNSNGEARIRVTDENGRTGLSGWLDSEESEKVRGLNIYVDYASERRRDDTIVADIKIGSEKLTFTNNSAVEIEIDGDDEGIEGTNVMFEGRVGALKKITISVYDPDDREVDRYAIYEEMPFVDPVFGTFQVELDGFNIPLDDSDRDEIRLHAGSDSAAVTISGTKFDFATYYDGRLMMADEDGNKIHPFEGAKANEDEYLMIGNAEGGYLLQVTDIHDSPRSDQDRVEFKDIINDKTIEASDFDETARTAEIRVGGEEYTVHYGTENDEEFVYVRNTDDVNEYFIYPPIKTDNGAFVVLGEKIGATAIPGLNIGDELLFYNGNEGTPHRMTVPPPESTANSTDTEVNGLTYGVHTRGTNSSIRLQVTLKTNGDWITKTGSWIVEPHLLLFEEEDDDDKHGSILFTYKAGGEDNEDIGVDGVYFNSKRHWSRTAEETNDDLKRSVDWWGTFVEVDESDGDQKSAVIKYPKSQMFANVYFSEVSSSGKSTTSSGKLGNVIVMASEASSVKDRNLIVVGGSCVNSVAATLLGVSSNTCGSEWTAKTNVGSGKFLIQSFGNAGSVTSKTALLVAGYQEADTRAAAKYLTTQSIDTATGKKYVGDTQASAVQVVSN